MAPKRAKKRAPKPPSKRALHYKVVELSNVDEHSLERTLNEWSPRGWSFDGVQFAMRESSKRPSMAFVFFTREGGAIPEPVEHPDAFRHESEAAAHLNRLAHAQPAPAAKKSTDAWSRLQALAGDDEAGDL
jgi:hypothetical protein